MYSQIENLIKDYFDNNCILFVLCYYLKGRKRLGKLPMPSILQYLLFGIITGLVITLVDWLYPLLLPNVYIPSDYVFSVFIFNLLFWSVIGLLYGVCMHLIAKRCSHYKPGKPFYHLVFLIIFSIIYGVLSKLYIGMKLNRLAGEAPFALKIFIDHGYDYNLCFVTAAVICIFAFAILKKSSLSPYVVLSSALVSIAVLFPFSSNLAALDRALHIYQRCERFVPFSRQQLLIALYSGGVAIIFGLYFIMILCLNRLKSINPATPFLVLLFIVTAAGAALLTHNNTLISSDNNDSVSKASDKFPPYVSNFRLGFCIRNFFV